MIAVEHQTLYRLRDESFGGRASLTSQQSVKIPNHLIPSYWFWLTHIPVSEPVIDPVLDLALRTIPAVSHGSQPAYQGGEINVCIIKRILK